VVERVVVDVELVERGALAVGAPAKRVAELKVWQFELAGILAV